MNKRERSERLREKPTIVVSALIKNGGKYLIVRDDGFSFWRPPGGRVDWGEPIDKALKREMREELCTNIEVVRVLGFGEDSPIRETRGFKTHRVVLYYLCRTKGKIKSYNDSEHGAKMKWVSLGELLKTKELEPAFRDMVKRFGKKGLA
jgi:ADP-ribose pyrophosphatase YjhB (NUDIX family)